jgi:rhamnose transport system substrate-binding protein
MKKYVLLLMVISAIVAFSLTGLGQESIDAKDISMILIPKQTGNPYWDACRAGFEEAQAELGFQFDFQGPFLGTATSQIEYIEAAVANMTSVIMLGANSPDALNTYLDDAREAGTRVVIFNQDIPGSEEHRDMAILPTDFDLVGEYQVECLGSQINYEGDIAVLSATTDAPDQNYWIEGMKKALEENPKYAKMNLLEVVYGDDVPEKSTTEMEALITKYPTLKGVIAPTTVAVKAAAKVIQIKGLADKITLTGLGLPSEMREFIKDGTVKEFQLWNPVDEGYLAGYYGVLLVQGKVGTEIGETFNAGRLGEKTIVENPNGYGQIITRPPFTFNASNIDDFDF